MPQITMQPSTQDAYLDSNMRGTNYGNSPALFVGLFLGAVIYRSLVQFNLTLPAGATLNAATLRLYLYRNDYPSTVKNLEVHPVLSTWQETSVTWNTVPLFDPVAAATASVTGGTDIFVTWDLTALTSSWMDGSLANSGILIKEANEGTNSLVGFRSKEYPNTLYWPKLVLDYSLPALGSVSLAERAFANQSETLTTADAFQFSAPRQTYPYSTASFLVVNTGANAAQVYLEISPDGLFWQPDSPQVTVGPGSGQALVPAIYSQYARLAYRSAVPGQPTGLALWFQAQV